MIDQHPILTADVPVSHLSDIAKCELRLLLILILKSQTHAPDPVHFEHFAPPESRRVGLETCDHDYP
jgi:hypothetical protein